MKKFILFGLTALCAMAAEYQSWLTNPCGCNEISRPVCGSDGKTYSNQCNLECALLNNLGLYMVHEGACHTEDFNPLGTDYWNSWDTEICDCQKILIPVCGSDGLTYPNQCILECDIYKNNPALQLAHQGPCKNNAQSDVVSPCGVGPCQNIIQSEVVSPCGHGPCQNNIQSEVVSPCGHGPCQNNIQLEVVVSSCGLGPCQNNIQSEVESTCGCDIQYQPICGSNDITYPNLCILACRSLRLPGLQHAYSGACIDEQVSASGLRPCDCMLTFDPVCGSDGKSFLNNCLLECEQATTTATLMMLHKGLCDFWKKDIKGVEQPDIYVVCNCIKMSELVCGSDGKSYENICILECAKRTNPRLEFAYAGKCNTKLENGENREYIPYSPCGCLLVFNPVCGSDGKTYINTCVLNCERYANPLLEISYEGLCELPKPQDKQIESPCGCDISYKPVCGSDGITYDNICILNCAKRLNIGLKFDYAGICNFNPKIPQVEEVQEPVNLRPCGCSLRHNHLCGSDGITYFNPCLFNCEKRKNPMLEVNYLGQCQDYPETKYLNPPDPLPPCLCADIELPLCGNDGRTYPNECYLNCEKWKNPDLKSMFDGPCRHYPQKKYNIPEILSPCVCDKSRIYKPVCGSNGKTYNNMCLINCAKRQYPGLKYAYEGACRPSQKKYNIPNKSSPCACDKSYKPVCGTDGKTYDNMCLMNCAKRENPELEYVYEGPCHTSQQKSPNISTKSPQCACDRSYKPLCGTDGKTYDNMCLLDCAKRQNPGIRYAHNGICRPSQQEQHNIPTKSLSCVCDKSYKPVCGTDGKIYNNMCLLNCAKNQNPGLNYAYEGPCRTSQQPLYKVSLPTKSPHCACDRSYKPLCGTDGKTYDNMCLLDCAKRQNPGLKYSYEGPCRTSQQAQYVHVPTKSPQCACDRSYKPLCGTDGKTYDNMCLLDCAKRQNPGLKYSYEGPCRTSQQAQYVQVSLPTKSPQCACDRSYKPLCGTDGKTYDNMCLLDCAKRQNPGLKYSYEGPCRSSQQSFNPSQCGCNITFGKICGSDGKTYTNDCLLNCAKRLIPGLSTISFGPCQKKITARWNLVPSCGCNEAYKPVCGNDGITYFNPCKLKCLKKVAIFSFGLSAKHNGTCSRN